MGVFFVKVLDISIAASFVICAALLLRPILKKMPAFIRCIIWGVVALRLIVPVSIESNISLVPRDISVAEAVNTGEGQKPSVSPPITKPMDNPSSTVQDEAGQNESIVMPPVQEQTPPAQEVTKPSVPETVTPNTDTYTEEQQREQKADFDIWSVLAAVWVCGVVLMLCYIAVSYLVIRRRVRGAVVYSDRVFVCPNISPFVFGLLKPQIYIPQTLTEEERNVIIAHEKAHIRRGDHISKPLAFLVLALHWFNPFGWVAYILFCRDVEFACDEKVIKGMDDNGKRSYSLALLKCSTGKRIFAAYPLSFGEVGSKERIKKVIKYKKPALWIACLAIVICAAVLLCFVTSPKDKESKTPITSNHIEEEISEETSEEISEEQPKEEYTLINYALGCDYQILAFDTVEDSSAYYTYDRDDANFKVLTDDKKLTDGKVPSKESYSGGVSEDCVVFADNKHVQISIDLGKSYRDIDSVKLCGFYMETEKYPADFDYKMYVSENGTEFVYASYLSPVTVEHIENNSDYDLFDCYLHLTSDIDCRYINIKLSTTSSVWALSEIEVCADTAVLQWDISADGTLTLKGEGQMPHSSELLWHERSDEVKKVEIGEGLTSISENAFSYLRNLESVSISNTVTSIGAGAFTGCTSLKSVTVPDSVRIIESGAFSACTALTEAVLPAKLTEINQCLFSGCAALEEIVLPDGVTVVKSDAFKDCEGLKSVKLSSKLNSIEHSAFRFCSALETIILPDGLTTIGTSAFEGCVSLNVPSLPQSLNTVELYAFADCKSTGKVIIPKNATLISSLAFGNATYYEVEEGNKYYCAEDGVLFSKDKVSLVAYPSASDKREYSVPAEVKEIGQNAFAKTAYLTNVFVPQGVSSIDSYAFNGCASLEYITLPDTVNSIGVGAFNECVSLKEILLPHGLTGIESNTFTGCIALNRVDMPDTVVSVGDNAFLGCSTLADISFSSNLRSISYNAFNGCAFLETITLPDSVESIGTNAFAFCTALKQIKLSSSLKAIPYGAFADCRELSALYIPEGVETVEDSAFFCCYNLKSVYLPGSLSKLKVGAFAGVFQLETINYGSTREAWSNITLEEGTLDEWYGVTGFTRKKVNCTDGTAGVMTSVVYNPDSGYYNIGYVLYDGTPQGIVTGLVKKNYAINGDSAINSLRIEDDTLYVDINQAFADSLMVGTEHEQTQIQTLCNTLIQTCFGAIGKNVIISVNGNPFVSSWGENAFSYSEHIRQ